MTDINIINDAVYVNKVFTETRAGEIIVPDGAVHKNNVYMVLRTVSTAPGDADVARNLCDGKLYTRDEMYNKGIYSVYLLDIKRMDLVLQRQG